MEYSTYAEADLSKKTPDEFQKNETRDILFTFFLLIRGAYLTTENIEILLKRIRQPTILHDHVFSNRTEVKPISSGNIQKLLGRVRIRQWTGAAQDDLMLAIGMMRSEVRIIAHLPKCWLCQMELKLDVERYNGTRCFWFLSLENSSYLERRYRSCPKERNYHIGNYWEQVQYYREHGNCDVPGENTVQFILDRAKWAYKIYGKQIHLARVLLNMVRNWNFNDDQQRSKFNVIYERLGMYDVALPIVL